VRRREGRFMVLGYEVCIIIAPLWASPGLILFDVSVGFDVAQCDLRIAMKKN
jgi:hypothetical protein